MDSLNDKWVLGEEGIYYYEKDVKEAVLDLYKLESYYESELSDECGNPKDEDIEKYFLDKYNINIKEVSRMEVQKKIFGDFP